MTEVRLQRARVGVFSKTRAAAWRCMCILTTMPARSMSVPPDGATVRRSRNESERRLGRALYAGRARNFIPKQSESYTVSRSAAN